MTAEAERHFHADMVAGANRLKREIGYNPTRFVQMVGEVGGVEAARRLLSGPVASDGFTILWEHNRLDMSVEAFVLLPWHANLFTDEERATARHRLAEYKFDVDRYLRGRHPKSACLGAVRDKRLASQFGRRHRRISLSHDQPSDWQTVVDRSPGRTQR